MRIINNLMDGDCPLLNNNNNNAAVLARRRRRDHDDNWHYWAGSVVRRLVPRFVPKRKHRRLSGGGGGFFQAQLRRMKSLKQRKQKNKGKLSSSSNNQIIIANSSSNCKTTRSLVNYQFTTATTCPILIRHGNNIHLKNQMNRLPKELLAEILVRLPVKYILRCRSVQKSWNYFIKSPVFIALQLNYQKQIINDNHHPKYLLFKYRYGFGLTLRFDHVRCKQYCRLLEFLPGYPGDAWFALSYGLICTSPLLDQPYNRNIYLWNPLINKYKTLPTSPLPSPQEEDSQAWEALAFGFLPQVNDYVVIHIIKPCLPPHPHSVIIGVYSLNTNSWKKSSQNNVFISRMSNNPDNVVFINGAAFWVGFNSNKQIILMCFDTKTNILSEISMPDSAASPPLVPVIHAIGQSIAYFVWEEGVIHFDMWVLKYDFINEFTWEKKMCVTPTPSEDVREEVVGVRNNGEPILAKSKHLISYNLDSHQAKGFVKSWDRWNPNFPYNCPYEDHGSPYVIRPFVESLVMLNDD